MKFSAVFSVLAAATAVFAHEGATGNTGNPGNPGSSSSSSSTTSVVDSGSCREYTYCMSPSSTTG